MGKKPVQMMCGLLVAGVLATVGCQSSKKYGSYGGNAPSGMASTSYQPNGSGMARMNPQGTIYSNPNNGATMYSVGGQQQQPAPQGGTMYTQPLNIPGAVTQSGYVNQGQPATAPSNVRYQQMPTGGQPQTYTTVPQNYQPMQQPQQGGYYQAPTGNMNGMPQQ